jgi:hypothetical protein
LVIVNFCLCVCAGLLFYSFITRITNLVDTALGSPRIYAAPVALCLLLVSALLWIASFLIYREVINKSEQFAV